MCARNSERRASECLVEHDVPAARQVISQRGRDASIGEVEAARDDEWEALRRRRVEFVAREHTRTRTGLLEQRDDAFAAPERRSFAGLETSQALRPRESRPARLFEPRSRVAALVDEHDHAARSFETRAEVEAQSAHRGERRSEIVGDDGRRREFAPLPQHDAVAAAQRVFEHLPSRRGGTLREDGAQQHLLRTCECEQPLAREAFVVGLEHVEPRGAERVARRGERRRRREAEQRDTRTRVLRAHGVGESAEEFFEHAPLLGALRDERIDVGAREESEQRIGRGRPGEVDGISVRRDPDLVAQRHEVRRGRGAHVLFDAAGEFLGERGVRQLERARRQRVAAPHEPARAFVLQHRAIEMQLRAPGRLADVVSPVLCAERQHTARRLDAAERRAPGSGQRLRESGFAPHVGREGVEVRRGRRRGPECGLARPLTRCATGQQGEGDGGGALEHGMGRMRGRTQATRSSAILARRATGILADSRRACRRVSMRPLDPNHFAHAIGEWLRTPGPQHDVAVSCRVRLARNLAGYPFVTRLDEKRAEQLAARVRDAIGRLAVVGGEPIWVDLPEASGLVRLLLRERHLASRDHAPVEERTRVAHGRAVVFASNETRSAMVNEEDHLRLQGFSAGFDLESAFHEVRELDRSIETELDIAHTTRLGYLTACPTNVGTGMRASVMLHLPALGMVRSELEKVFAAAHRTGLAVRGMYGEGSRAAGDFYQVSNQVTLGRSEDDLLAELQALVPGVIEFERRVRTLLFEQRRGALEDRVARSLGTLSSARLVSTEDALRHLSHVRLGVALGVVQGHTTLGLDVAAIRIQRGHLQARHPDEAGAGLLDSAARDRLRATYLRTLVGGSAAPSEEPPS